MKCPKCNAEMDPTPSTEMYPNCNTWTCESCKHVEPEMGSFRLYEATPEAQLRDALKRYDQITRVVIKALRRDGGVRTEMADELEACLNNACEILDGR